MSRKPRYGDARNVLRIFRWLQESRLGRASFKDLCEEVDISLRTIQRYANVLREEYEGLIDTETIGGKRYLVLKRFSLENRTGYQLAPLYLSRFFFSFLKGTYLDEALGQTVELFESGLEHGERCHLGSLGRKFWVVCMGPKDYSDKDEEIDILLRALLQQRRVKIDYHKPGSDEPAHYLFSPYTMLVYKQGLYLIGAADDHDHIFYLAVERILSCRLTSEGFDYPRDFSPKEFCEGSFGIFMGKPSRVIIRFSKDVVEYVAARNWHPTQSIRKLKEGGLELTMKVGGLEEVVPWVLSFGEHAEVIKPPELRRQISDAVHLMSRIY